jgi:predicted dehydrogenase
MACIGVGGRGTADLRGFRGLADTQLVAVCDVDTAHRVRGVAEAKLDARDGYNDFREVLARGDVDTVMIATPDHWHAHIAIAAARAGKDIYCEKPLAASIGESLAVRNTVRAENRVLQCGTQRRSEAWCRHACELVRNGRIGKLRTIEVGVPGKFHIKNGYTGYEKAQSVPKGFDYELWLGSAPEAPYTPGRCHFNFRWINDYAPGYITDWGAHFVDVAQWGNGTDGSGPTSIVARQFGRRETGLYDAPEQYEIEYGYASGARMVMRATADSKAWGVHFIGDEGIVFAEVSSLRTHPENLATSKIGDDEIHLYKSDNHYQDFIKCVKSRRDPAASVEIGHGAATLCHLGAIAGELGRPLEWDPLKETFVNDAEASARVERPLRGPWVL